MLGLWNEAWQAAGRPQTDPWEYTLALRKRLDTSGLSHVKLIAPDGDIGAIVPALKANATLKHAIWGLGAHYPGGNGADPSWRPDLDVALWSAEDYSTYSDATGAGCWARLLVQNAGYGYSATISWYLIGAFTRGRHYDSDGLLRAEWPSSGHWEVTPMAWMTMHWTLFSKPGWTVSTCSTPHCKLAGGGNYVALVSPDGRDMTVIVETFLHSASQCIRHDPPDWTVEPLQTVKIELPVSVTDCCSRYGKDGGASRMLDLWKSCTGWRYPAHDDGYMMKQTPVKVSSGGFVTFTATVNCYYTLTTIAGVAKPTPPTAESATPRPAFFPLPFFEDFEGVTAGGEAPYFGDQEGKWETVIAGGGRSGKASQQQLKLDKPWPILEPQCNDHGAPISIIGDLFFESAAVTADLLIEEHGAGAGVALRVRISSSPKNIRGVTPGIFLYIGATPGLVTINGHGNPGGAPPAPNSLLAGWALCADSYCNTIIKHGPLPAALGNIVAGHWHTVTLEVTDNMASGSIDSINLFSKVSTTPPPLLPPLSPPSSLILQQCIINTTLLAAGQVITGGDYRQFFLGSLNNSSTAVHICEKACCMDGQCSAWAIAKGKCWLKNHGWSISKMGSWEVACAVKPKSTRFPPIPVKRIHIPPSGWAGIAATIGLSQVDNFKLVGTAPGSDGAAVPPCRTKKPAAGSLLVSTPCDYPGATVVWSVDPDGGVIQLNQMEDRGTVGPQLCVGASNKTENHSAAVVLVSCDSKATLIYSISTGRISPRSESHICVTAAQRGPDDKGAPAMMIDVCEAIPSQTQQFQYNPTTGALRPKASACIANSLGESTAVQYRDCCIAFCSSHL